MIVLFFIAIFLSFIGSLPFGMINMAVAHTAIQKGIKAAIWVGLGAAFVELFQVLVALKCTWLFEGGGTFSNVFQIVAICIFFMAGIYFFFFAKAKPQKEKKQNTEKRRNGFLKGMFISSLNLMVIPYWMFYGALLVTNGWLEKDNISVVVFSIGAATGAFLLLGAYAYLGDKVLSKSQQVTKWVNKFIGVLLFGFGIYQLVKWLNG